MTKASKGVLSAIADHLKSDFICSGSYPAFVIADEMRSLLGSNDFPPLTYNDIDVYYGNFGNSEMRRNDCI